MEAQIELYKNDGGWHWVVDEPEVGYHESITYPTREAALVAVIAGTIRWSFSSTPISIPTADGLVICPQCGYEQDEVLYCQKCGHTFTRR